MSHRAIAITAREQAEVVPVDAPGPLGPEDIGGQTVCTLISPGTEISHAYTGDRFPAFVGYAAVFRAAEVGAAVTDVAPGDLLFCMGRHGSYQQVNRRNVVKVPEGLAPEVAVIARLTGVSMTTLMTTSARPGDQVIITGAGPVGFLAAQAFAVSGYRVHVVEPHPGRRRQAEELLALQTYERVPVEDASVCGHVALVVDCSGHEQAVIDGCKVVRRGGEVVLVGVPWKRHTDVFAHELLDIVFHKYAVLRTGWEWELPHHPTPQNPHSIFGNFATALGWLANGSIRTHDLITTASPENAQMVYQDLLHRRAEGLFSVFVW